MINPYNGLDVSQSSDYDTIRKNIFHLNYS
jgi:hypothetical protein